LSIFDVIEDLDVHSNTANISIPIQAIAILKRSEGEDGELAFVGQLEVTGPSGQSLINQPINARMETQHRRIRIKVNLGLPIQGSGLYKFKMRGRNGDVMTVETDVRIAFHLERGAALGIPTNAPERN